MDRQTAKIPAGFIANKVINPPVPGQAIGQAIPTAEGYTNPQTGEKIFMSTYGDNVGEITHRIAAPEGYQPRSSQPTMSPFSNTQGSFGTGAMPYTQPYYQRSFNPYAGGYGMGFGGGMPSSGGFARGPPVYCGFGGGPDGGWPSDGGRNFSSRVGD